MLGRILRTFFPSRGHALTSRGVFKWQRAGATLVEPLVVMALLGVIAVAAFSLYSTGYTAAKLAQGLEQASLLAQQRLEQARVHAICTDRSLTQLRQPVDPVSFPGFDWETIVQERAPGLHLVSVTVFWSQRGRERQVSLTTFVRARQGEP